MKTTSNGEYSTLDRPSCIANGNNGPAVVPCNGINDDVTCTVVDVPPTTSQTNRVGFRLVRAYRKKKRKPHRRTAYDRDVVNKSSRADDAAEKRLPVDDTKSEDDDDEEDEEEEEKVAAPIAGPELKSSCTVVVEPDVETIKIDRMRLCLNCCKRCAAFLLSTVGLSVLTVAYTIIGGLIFSAVESPNERHVQSGVKDSLRWHVTSLWEVTSEFNVLHPVSSYLRLTLSILTRCSIIHGDLSYQYISISC